MLLNHFPLEKGKFKEFIKCQNYYEFMPIMSACQLLTVAK